jgi:hypothetical protein
MDKNEILNRSHEELFEMVKLASGTEAKLDLFLNIFEKYLWNDFKCLEKEVQDLKKFQWKLAGGIAVAVFLLQIAANVALKLLAK